MNTQMKKLHASGPFSFALRNIRGFSLIELMISMAIVAILAAIAYPSYQNYIVRTYRNSAKACLGEYAQFMERYYTTNNLTYVGARAVGVWPTLNCARDSNMDQRYTFALTADPTETAFNLAATPVTGSVQATKDAKCGTLGLNQTGARSASGPAGVSGCW